jgi:hypothetical protein
MVTAPLFHHSSVPLFQSLHPIVPLPHYSIFPLISPPLPYWTKVQYTSTMASIYVHHERSLYMSKSLTIWALIASLVVAGCMTETQFLSSRQPTAIQSAVSRGQFEMNCPNATGEVLSQEITQPAIQGPLVQGESRGLFTIGVAGCGQRRVYQVFCPMGGDSCTALEGRTS